LLSCWSSTEEVLDYTYCFQGILFPALSCTNYKVLDLILRSFIHFELTLVQGDRHGSRFSFLQVDKPLFPATFAEAAVFSPSYVFGNFVKNKVGVAMWIYIRVLYSVPLVFISAFEPVPCCFYCYGSVE
jgi:hypothetical protein